MRFFFIECLTDRTYILIQINATRKKIAFTDGDRSKGRWPHNRICWSLPKLYYLLSSPAMFVLFSNIHLLITFKRKINNKEELGDFYYTTTPRNRINQSI